jgi:RNA polymerase sigma-70 factor (ECF subfamily)
MASWLQRVLAGESGFEAEVVQRYSVRLLDLASRELPDRVRGRVDPEDLVQSVYRSFFKRLNEGRFSFNDSSDLWRLLAAMTFQRVTKAVRYHQQQRRDVRRERRLPPGPDSQSDDPAIIERQPGPEDLVVLVDSLERLLDQLPETYRDIAVLHLQGVPIDEIARSVNRSRRTVFRALAELEELAVKSLGTPA